MSYISSWKELHIYISKGLSKVPETHDALKSVLKANCKLSNLCFPSSQMMDCFTSQNNAKDHYEHKLDPHNKIADLCFS